MIGARTSQHFENDDSGRLGPGTSRCQIHKIMWNYRGLRIKSKRPDSGTSTLDPHRCPDSSPSIKHILHDDNIGRSSLFCLERYTATTGVSSIITFQAKTWWSRIIHHGSQQCVSTPKPHHGYVPSRSRCCQTRFLLWRWCFVKARHADFVTGPGLIRAATECVSDEALSHLKTYKYSAVDKSPVSEYILKPYVGAPLLFAYIPLACAHILSNFSLCSGTSASSSSHYGSPRTW
jgi:hypothetical protein